MRGLGNQCLRPSLITAKGCEDVVLAWSVWAVEVDLNVDGGGMELVIAV